jgi:thiol-disulfide isomerase/thioredoxin/uncharacterized membrane protein YphA (DoxX/SURF4 family)
MNVVVLMARFLLAAIFGVAGVTKLADPAGSRKSMADFGVPQAFAGLLGLLLPVAEVVFAIALVPVASARWGASGILALLGLFIVAIGVSLMRGRTPDCHCFGQLQSSPIGWGLVARNAVLAAVAGFVVAEGPGPGAIEWAAGLSREESELLALAVIVALLAAFQLWAFLGVLKQNGRLLLRIEALEKGAPAKAEAAPAGLPVNSLAPGFSLADLEGRMVSFEELGQAGRPVLLLFGEPGCGACDAILPDVARWQKEYEDRLEVVQISRGEVKLNRAKSEKHGVRSVLLQADREVAKAYRADQNPSAVLVAEGRIASPLALGAEAIRQLVARALLPPSVKKGDAVPSFTLPDLKGEAFDVSQLRGALLLFWNPSCGFCDQMLEDLKAWERNPPPGAPELVVISAGSPEEIRKFRSRLLLDPHFAANQVFNAGGTPSAVLIDEQGRVASEVGAGASEVLALAGAVAVGKG